jgi:signal peptidase I
MVLPFTGYAVSIASCCLTAFTGRRNGTAVTKVWVLVIVPVALLFCSSEMGLALRASGLHVYNVPSDSMSPTIYGGDRIMVDQHFFRHKSPNRGDVIVFCHRGVFLVKRVIGIAGDTVRGVNQRIELNGQELSEPYVIHGYPQLQKGELDNFGPITVPAGELFVMGDNRDVSLDSRIQSGIDAFGPAYSNQVVGKPLYHFAAKGSSSYDGQAIK